ncbi:MAG TPA: hypothetical protein VNA89_10315 [Gemmatimonadaceae bacterium]|nr:hypothetical protein [Gemmatimonadaceae bacterium]
MALREIVDDRGVQWKVWDVVPAGMHPATAAELFVGDYQEGWLAFESATERRRLAQFPVDWEAMSRAELLRLSERAEVVVPRRRRDGATGPRPGDRPEGTPGRKPPAR